MSKDAKEFAAVRRRLGMTQVELGEALGRTSRQIIAYENGNYGVSRIVWLALAALEHLPPEKRRVPEGQDQAVGF